MSEEFKNLDEEKIRLLKWPEAIRQRYGMYLDAGSACVNNCLREIIDNSLDEVQYGADKIMIHRNLGGYSMVWDSGRGIPISFSDEVDDFGNPITQAKLSISSLHSGSKFSDASKVNITIGMNGVGSSAVCAISDDYILMSRITPTNFDRSIPQVQAVWEENPVRKKDLFYIVWYKRGVLYFEGAGKLSDLEKMIFGKKVRVDIPSGGSTVVLFRLDSSIFTKEELDSMEINIQNLQYFLLIQERFYGKKKVSIDVEGNILTGSGFKGFGCDMIREIIPADPSANPKLGLFISVGYDEDLGPKEECGSVNSLTVDSGVHISYVENAFAKAIKENYGIKHRYLTTGLKLCVVALGSEVVFSSQTKEKLKSFTKVKETDFAPLVKEFIKMFKKYDEYWNAYVDKLNYLADSMKSLSAMDKAQKMIDSSTGSSFYKSRSGLVDGFADATAKNRWDCELFLCFTGDTEILTCNDERIKFTDLVRRVDNGESIYTFSCKPDGEIIPSKIIAAKEIKKVSKLCKVTLDNGEIVKCTPDHKFMLRDGQYKEAGSLKPGESLMPCYITYSDNYDNEKRRVVLDMKPNNGKSYRPDFVSLENGGTLKPVFHIMSSHPDAIVDESSLVSGIVVHRHHLDKNKLNDYPSNLLICSSEKHFSLHCDEMSKRAHEIGHSNPETYNKMYIDNKRTEQFKKNASEGHKKYYSSEEGSNMKNHLKEKAIEEWNNESLRAWRAAETSKYSSENPGWAKNNSWKSHLSYWKSNLYPKIEKYISENNLEKTSKSFNTGLIYAILENKGNHNHWPEFDSIINYDPEIMSTYKKVDDDSIEYIKDETVLESLLRKKLEVNTENFNNEFKNLFEKPIGRKQIVSGGYRFAKKHFPELVKKYEAILNKNHKVVNVELYEVDQESVYCLEVDSEEHNFPLAAGVFVKNCEGLSPAGSLKAGRKLVNGEMTAAILPLRGKILNVSDATIDKALDNKEISTIFTLMGVGIQEKNVTTGCKTPEEAYERLKQFSRYGKICLAADADSDGQQIISLILYMFSKFARFLIDLGCVYISLSPLFEQDGKYYYPGDPIDTSTGLPIGLNPKKPFRRWKGLGSIPKELIYDSFFNPATRRLIQVTPEGIDYAMSLTEDITVRKNLLYEAGILTNPYNFTDL